MGVLRVKVNGQWIDVATSNEGPRGLVARPALITADQIGIAALADLTGFSQTITVVAGRYYEVKWMFLTGQQTATGNQSFQMVLDGVGHQIGTLVVAAGGLTIWSGAFQFVGGAAVGNVPAVAAGSRIIKIRGSANAGSMNISNAGTMNGRFSIQDIGSTLTAP